MKNNQLPLTLRCFGEEKNGQWSVVCVDFCLAAQSHSLNKAKQLLREQLKDYLFDALAGEDKEHAVALLTRKAPTSLMLRYYWIWLQNKIHDTKQKAKSILFIQPMPMKPC
jgi:hypothetical protein